MADKNFGVRKIDLLSSSGTPTIDSPNNLNINAVNVAISTDLSVGGESTFNDNIILNGQLSVSSVSTFNNNVRVSGIVTANSVLISNDDGNSGSVLIDNVSGSYSQLTFRDTIGVDQSLIRGISANLLLYSGALGSAWINTYSLFYPNGDVFLNLGNVGTTNICNELYVRSGITTIGGIQISSGIVTASSVGIVTYYGDTSNTTDGRWTLGASGTSDYTFTGIGFTQTTNDPVLYLARGRVYEFVNNSGGSHPFEIRVSNGGTAYNDGVTNNGAATGVIRFEVPFNAPNTLYYQCTVHSGMGNTINIYPSI